MIDQFGRTIDSIRISVTNRNNFTLKCLTNVVPNFIPKHLNAMDYNELSVEEIMKIIEVMSENGLEKVKIIGGEPLLRDDLSQIIRQIRTYKNIYEVALTTNGILLEERAEELKKSGLTRVNIQLPTLVPDKMVDSEGNRYLDKVLAGIEKAKSVGLTPIKLNVELMKGFNDDEIENFVAMAKSEEIDVRFVEIVPETHSQIYQSFFMSSSTVLDMVSDLMPLTKSDQQSLARYFKQPDSKGRVGLISPISCRFCDRCNCVSITADGFLKYCMNSKEEVALRPLMKIDKLFEKTLRRTIFNKPDAYQIHSEENQESVQY